MKKKLSLFFVFILLLVAQSALALDKIPSLELNSQDRILILAPHPDDEVIGTGGVIQQAVKNNIPVKIVYLTNGDNNELAFIVYEKRIVFKRKAILHMGELRRQESIASAKSLGLKENQLTFLGYPDFGTQEIFTKYWGDVAPYKNLITRVNKVSYKECMSYGSLFVGESILRDLKKILLDYKPTKIFVTTPVDTNRDHRAFYLFLRVALWDLQGKRVCGRHEAA